MKNKLIIYGLLIMILPRLYSCSLEEKSKNSIGFKDYYKTEAQCLSAVNSCYNQIQYIYLATFLIITDACTDLAFMDSADQNAKFNVSPANPQFGVNMWNNGYKGVMFCNAAIQGIQDSPIDAEAKKPMLAECMTVRAMYYYILTSSFGDVPFYTKAVIDADILDEVAAIGRMDANETRKYLIQELIEYSDYLPKKRAVEVENNYASAPFAYMLIAKLAMWNKDFATAKIYLEKIREIYGKLEPDRYPITDIMAKTKNVPESIFEIQRTYSVLGLKRTHTVACICTPVRTKDDIYDGIKIPELGNQSTIWGCISPNQYLTNSVFSNINDPRRDLCLGFSYNGQRFKRPAAGYRPWLGPKFWNFGMVGSQDGNNQKVFRFGEALLMLSECASELGETELALETINEVKQRVGMSELETYPGHSKFMIELREEKARELFGEYGRKWDLVRWGIWYDLTMEKSGKEYGNIRNNMKPCHEYYPIPDSEVKRSRGILTNDAYKAWGL